MRKVEEPVPPSWVALSRYQSQVVVLCQVVKVEDGWRGQQIIRNGIMREPVRGELLRWLCLLPVEAVWRQFRGEILVYLGLGGAVSVGLAER